MFVAFCVVALALFLSLTAAYALGRVRFRGRATVLLLVLGLAGFLTGGFSFTKESTQAKLGPLELTVKEKESVNIPQWMSLGAMVIGGVVLVLGFRKR